MRSNLILILAVACGAFVPTEAMAERPNLVFVLADDHRHDLMGCAGHEIIRTPSLDALAEKGVRFRNAFVTTSICAASRASILSGLHERTHRYTFGTPPLAEPLGHDSYPSVLRQAGYETVFIGKLGVNMDGKIRESMFDHFHPFHRNPYLKPQKDGSKRHISQLCGDRAIEFLRNRDTAKPFCLSLSFNAPHAEDSDKENHFPPPAAVADWYADVNIPDPDLSDPAIFESQPAFLQKSMNRQRWFWRWDTAEKYQRNIRNYYRMISGIDHVIGRVVQELDAQQLTGETVILFAGDNGYYAGSRGFAGKWSHYEESLRIPMILMDPRTAADQQNRVIDATVLNIDIPATLLDLAGATTPDRYQGASLVPFLENDQVDGWRHDFFCEHLMDNASIPKWEGIRDNRWVYARYFEQDPPFEFLHDLQSDPHQLTNLAIGNEPHPQLEIMRQRCLTRRSELGGEYRPNPRKPRR